VVGLRRLPRANTWKALKAKVDFNEINTFACQTLCERGKRAGDLASAKKLSPTTDLPPSPPLHPCPLPQKKLNFLWRPKNGL
jgi:hypothetical protein